MKVKIRDIFFDNRERNYHKNSFMYGMMHGFLLSLILLVIFLSVNDLIENPISMIIIWGLGLISTFIGRYYFCKLKLKNNSIS